jgi:hypothetical protein
MSELSRENGRTNKIDLLGKRFGKIVVLDLADVVDGKEFFNCKCDCGSIIRVERRYLLDGSKTHCGCGNRIDMTGKKIGMLTVLSFDGIGKHGTALWRCRCDCGNEKVVDGALLRGGVSISCGCLQSIATRKARKKYNDYTIDGDVVYVKLSNSDKTMICDLDDWDRLKKYCWSIGSGGYARTNLIDDVVRRTFHMNVIDCPEGMVRDHINRNRLDNRKCNLRIVSMEVNARNTSLNKNNTTGYKGVTRPSSDNKFHAQISVGNKTYHLGRFDTAEEAYQARLRGEEKYFGEVYSE